MPYIGTCFRFYTQMRVEKKKKKHLHIEFIVTSHNSVYFDLQGNIVFFLCSTNQFFHAFEKSSDHKCRILMVEFFAIFVLQISQILGYWYFIFFFNNIR